MIIGEGLLGVLAAASGVSEKEKLEQLRVADALETLDVRLGGIEDDHNK